MNLWLEALVAMDRWSFNSTILIKWRFCSVEHLDWHHLDPDTNFTKHSMGYFVNPLLLRRAKELIALNFDPKLIATE